MSEKAMKRQHDKAVDAAALNGLQMDTARYADRLREVRDRKIQQLRSALHSNLLCTYMLLLQLKKSIYRWIYLCKC
jgi:hypothetical protein